MVRIIVVKPKRGVDAYSLLREWGEQRAIVLLGSATDGTLIFRPTEMWRMLRMPPVGRYAIDGGSVHLQFPKGVPIQFVDTLESQGFELVTLD